MSKYRLINLKTKEEHLCDKVTIDGFDYYVKSTDSKRGWFYCYRTKTLFKDEGCDINCCNSDINVLATNNPNIDISKIVNVVDELASEYVDSKRNSIDSYSYLDVQEGFKHGYNKSQETYSFSEEDLIEFLDFSKSTNKEKSAYELNCLLKGKHIDSKEILQIWKEQRSKIIYYE